MDEDKTETTEETAEDPQVNGLLVTREFNEQGGVEITGIQMLGDVRVTEVQTLLGLALQQFKQQAGL